MLVLGGIWQRRPPEARPTVGDWVPLDTADGTLLRVLERRSVFRRVAAGPAAATQQAVAANVDTLLIVSSCNREFKESRLERYLALAREADIDPLIVLSKAARPGAALRQDRQGDQEAEGAQGSLGRL